MTLTQDVAGLPLSYTGSISQSIIGMFPKDQARQVFETVKDLNAVEPTRSA
jgi:hypothetical protein